MELKNCYVFISLLLYVLYLLLSGFLYFTNVYKNLETSLFVGVQLKKILEYEEIHISELAFKKVAVDSFNMLYQFISSIRQYDGTLLLDSKGRVTSHLKGLFNRLVYFKKQNIKAAFVFDGEPPSLKKKERALRAEKKMLADKKYKESLNLGLIEDAKKYAQGTSRLNSEMVEQAKELIELFGFPTLQAPSEGEAQASFLVSEGSVFACVSQDFDSLLFGSDILIRNLSVSNRRKVPGTTQYREVPIEMYNLKKNLARLNISQEQLIIIAILCGTDFNLGGIKGIGPKKALKLVKSYLRRYDELFDFLDWNSYFSYTWREVYNTISKMPRRNEEIKFREIQKDGIKKFLGDFDFELSIVERQLKQIKNVKTLERFF